MHKDEKNNDITHLHQQARRSVDNLLDENEALHKMVADLERDRVQLESQLISAQQALQENGKLQSVLSTVESEKLRLEEQARAIKADLERHRKQHGKLKKQMSEIEAENQHFFEQYAEVIKQNSKLANLYVTSYRLHESLDRAEVLEIIKEIIVNLIGSEQLAIFEMAENGQSLRLSLANEVDAAMFQQVEFNQGLIGRVAATGEIYQRSESCSEQCGEQYGEQCSKPCGKQCGESEEEQYRLSSEADLTACIPLKIEERVIGAIAIFQLLPQKAGLASLDQELFELLTAHAATALYCSSLHSKASMAII